MTDPTEQEQVGKLAGEPDRDQPAAPLHAYKLVPIAAPDDPNWDNAPNHGVVTVCALSPGDARLVAAEAEIDFLETGAKPGSGVSTNGASAFRSDKLYSVREIDMDPPPTRRGLIST